MFGEVGICFGMVTLSLFWKSSNSLSGMKGVGDMIDGQVAVIGGPILYSAPARYVTAL